MEYQKVIRIPDGLRVFVRNTKVNTVVLVEVDGAYIVRFDVDKWVEFTKSIATICHKFHRGFDAAVGYPEIEYEKILRITNGLRVLLRHTKTDTIVMIETDEKFVITLNVEKWMKCRSNRTRVLQTVKLSVHCKYSPGGRRKQRS